MASTSPKETAPISIFFSRFVGDNYVPETIYEIAVALALFEADIYEPEDVWATAKWMGQAMAHPTADGQAFGIRCGLMDRLEGEDGIPFTRADGIATYVVLRSTAILGTIHGLFKEREK